ALGLLRQAPDAWFARGADADEARIQALIDERTAAKKARDFARADAIRDQLAAEGILLEGTPQGVRWKRARRPPPDRNPGRAAAPACRDPTPTAPSTATLPPSRS